MLNIEIKLNFNFFVINEHVTQQLSHRDAYRRGDGGHRESHGPLVQTFGLPSNLYPSFTNIHCVPKVHIWD